MKFLSFYTLNVAVWPVLKTFPCTLLGVMKTSSRPGSYSSSDGTRSIGLCLRPCNALSICPSSLLPPYLVTKSPLWVDEPPEARTRYPIIGPPLQPVNCSTSTSTVQNYAQYRQQYAHHHSADDNSTLKVKNNNFHSDFWGWEII